MRLTWLSGDPASNDLKICPAVYAMDRTDQETRIVQGPAISDAVEVAQLSPAAGEGAVRIPAAAFPSDVVADRTDPTPVVVHGRLVTEPDVLAQLTLGPGEIAVEVPAQQITRRFLPGGTERAP